MLSSVCPFCGAAIQFKSRFSAVTVCHFCHSSLIRDGNDLVYDGKIAKLSEDMSCLQIGTHGSFENQSFEIIGQIKMDWSQGYWNEWFVVEEKGGQAWISEAMGFYSYIKELNVPLTFNVASVQIGDPIILNEIKYVVSDIKQFVCQGYLGELPFKAEPELKGLSLDLKSEDEHCAYIECTSSGYRIYVGKNVSFEQLNLTDLREIDGW